MGELVHLLVRPHLVPGRPRSRRADHVDAVRRSRLGETFQRGGGLGRFRAETTLCALELAEPLQPGGRQHDGVLVGQRVDIHRDPRLQQGGGLGHQLRGPGPVRGLAETVAVVGKKPLQLVGEGAPPRVAGAGGQPREQPQRESCGLRGARPGRDAGLHHPDEHLRVFADHGDVLFRGAPDDGVGRAVDGHGAARDEGGRVLVAGPAGRPETPLGHRPGRPGCHRLAPGDPRQPLQGGVFRRLGGLLTIEHQRGPSVAPCRECVDDAGQFVAGQETHPARDVRGLTQVGVDHDIAGFLAVFENQAAPRLVELGYVGDGVLRHPQGDAGVDVGEQGLPVGHPGGVETLRGQHQVDTDGPAAGDDVPQHLLDVAAVVLQVGLVFVDHHHEPREPATGGVGKLVDVLDVPAGEQAVAPDQLRLDVADDALGEFPRSVDRHRLGVGKPPVRLHLGTVAAVNEDELHLVGRVAGGQAGDDDVQQHRLAGTRRPADHHVGARLALRVYAHDQVDGVVVGIGADPGDGGAAGLATPPGGGIGGVDIAPAEIDDPALRQGLGDPGGQGGGRWGVDPSLDATPTPGRGAVVPHVDDDGTGDLQIS